MTTSPMTLDSVRQQLSTPEGFAKAVAAKRGIFTAAITCLVVGVIGVGMNLFQLGSASDWDWDLMTGYFFDAEAIEFSGYRSGRSEMWRWVYVWGPVVLIPLGIILLIVHFATKQNAGAGLYSDYRSRGWVALQRKPGLTVKVGNAASDIAVFSHPSVPLEVFDQVGQRYAQYLGSLDKKAMKEVSAAAVKQKVIVGTSAAALFPEFPPAIVAAQAVKGDSGIVVVVPPEGGKGKFRILPVKS